MPARRADARSPAPAVRGPTGLLGAQTHRARPLPPVRASGQARSATGYCESNSYVGSPAQCCATHARRMGSKRLPSFSSAAPATPAPLIRSWRVARRVWRSAESCATDLRHVEHDSVVSHLVLADLAHADRDRRRGRVAVREEVSVVGRAVHVIAPGGEEHRALQDERVAVRRRGEATEEPLGCIAVENALRRFVERCRQLPQFAAHIHGPRRIPPLHARTASRYGRITRPTRPTSAARVSSATVTRFRRNASFRASSATSRPILWR